MPDAGFETFFREHHLRACRFACALVGAAEAEDAVQEAFYRLYLRRGRLDGLDNPAAYFFRILFNRCRTILRRRQFRETVRGLFRTASSGGAPDAALELRQVWETLTPRERAVFVLMDYQGWTAAETGAALGMAAATVRVHRHRLREKIQRWEATS